MLTKETVKMSNADIKSKNQVGIKMGSFHQYIKCVHVRNQNSTWCH